MKRKAAGNTLTFSERDEPQGTRTMFPPDRNECRLIVRQGRYRCQIGDALTEIREGEEIAVGRHVECEIVALAETNGWDRVFSAIGWDGEMSEFYGAKLRD